MLRRTESMFTKWISTVVLCCMLGSIACGQSDDGPPDSEAKAGKSGFSNPFSKMFSRKEGSDSDESRGNPRTPAKAPTSKPSSSKPSLSSKPSSSNNAKPSTNAAVPASPTAARGGLLVPLKSFTNRVFRPGDDRDPVAQQAELPELRDLDRPAPSNRPALEPFRNLPRPRQEARNRSEESDIQLEKVVDSPTPQFSGRPAPIVSRDKSATVPAAPSASAGKTDSPLGQPSMVNLEPNSTSRRTNSGSDTVSTAENPKFEYNGPSLLDLSKDSAPRSRNGNTVATPTKGVNRFTAAANNDREKGEVAGPAPSETSTAPLSPSSSDTVAPAPSVTAIRSRANNTKPVEPEQVVAPSQSEPKPRMEPATTSVNKPAQLKQTPAKSESELRRNDVLNETSQPGIKLSVNGPDALLVGQESMFEIVARNDGTSDLNGLIVRFGVPNSVMVGNITTNEGAAAPENDAKENAVTWEMERLAAGATKTLRFTLQTSKPEHFAVGLEWTSLPQSSEMQIKVQQPQLEVALEGPSEAEYSAPQNYRLRIKNPGNAVAKSVEVVLTAEKYGSNQSVVGDIPAGGEKVIDVELVFQQQGVVPISVVASSNVSKLQAQNAINVRVRQSELVAQWNGPAEFYQGSVADYELVLTNNGDAVAQNAACTVKLPQGAEPTVLPPGAQRRGNVIQWEVKRLQPQETLTFPFRMSLTKIGENPLAFTATCKNGEESNALINTMIDSIVDLQVTVRDPVAPAPVGQPVYYEIEIYNRGKKVAKEVEVLAAFSDGIEPIRIDGHPGRIVPGQVAFNPIPSIGADEKVVLRVAAEASTAGLHRFRVEVKNQSGEADILQEETTRYLATGNGKTDRR